MEQLIADASQKLKCIFYSNILYQVTSELFGVECKDVSEIVKNSRRYSFLVDSECELSESIICEINEFLRYQLKSTIFKCYEETLCIPGIIIKECDLTIIIPSEPGINCDPPNILLL